MEFNNNVVSYDSYLEGNPETVSSYEYSLSYGLSEYEPIIDISDNISLTTVWTSKNVKYGDGYKNEHMITIKNSSSYDRARCYIQVLYYGMDGNILMEKDCGLGGNHKDILYLTPAEVSKVEFKVLYAYALMTD